LGLESGARKVLLVQATDELTSENTKWEGGHDGFYFFKTDEKVEVRLSFVGTDIGAVDTLRIAAANNFINPEKGLLTVENGNFELPVGYGPGQGDWFFGGNANYEIPDLDIGRKGIEDTGIPAVQGDYYYSFYGTRSVESGYIAGGSQGARNGVYYDLPSDPSRVWVNVLVYGSGDFHTNMLLLMLEADSVNVSNPDDIAMAGIDDGVQLKLPVNHTGWKWIRARYDAIPFASYCIPGVEGGGCGNKVHEPHRIDLIALSFESEDVSKPSSCIIDQIMFTVDQPFNPENY
jgi:hypothetical protein